MKMQSAPHIQETIEAFRIALDLPSRQALYEAAGIPRGSIDRWNKRFDGKYPLTATQIDTLVAGLEANAPLAAHHVRYTYVLQHYRARLYRAIGKDADVLSPLNILTDGEQSSDAIHEFLAVISDTLQQYLPMINPVEIATAIAGLFRGERATIGGNALTFDFGDGMTIMQSNAVIGCIVGGDINQTLYIQLPQPLDPLPAALAVFASLPLDYLPPPTPQLPARSRMPLARYPQFVGRELDLMNLARAIADPQPTLIVSAVATGLGGIGKTSLAVEFAYRYGRYFQGGVFWLNCEKPQQIPSEIAECAAFMELPTEGISLEQRVNAVRLAWQEPLPRLLIFDNCESPEELAKWQPTIGGCRVLVTARREFWPTTLYHVTVNVLDRAESIMLLRQLCPRLEAAETDGLAADLGDLPLALHLAGSYLATYDPITVKTYRDQLSLTHPSLQGRGTDTLPTRHERDVARTFAISYNQLNETNPIDRLAQWLLACAACLAPGIPIPRDLLLAMVPNTTSIEDAIDALRKLHALGLLGGNDAATLHRLLAAFVNAEQSNSATQQDVEDYLLTHLERLVSEQAFTAIEPLMPHIDWIAAQAFRYGHEQTRIHLLCLLVVGGVSSPGPSGFFDRYGLPQSLLNHLDQIILVLQQRGPEYHTTLHYLFGKQGNAAHNLRQFQKALDAYTNALIYAPDATRKIMLQAAVGRVMNKVGQADDALAQLMHAYRDAQHPDVESALSYVLEVLSEYLGLHQEYAGAYQYAGEAIKLNYRIDNRIRLCYSLINYGSAALRLGYTEEATKRLAEALTVAEDLQLIQLRAHAHRAYAEACRAQGNSATAIMHFEAALKLALRYGDIDNADETADELIKMNRDI